MLSINPDYLTKSFVFNNDSKLLNMEFWQPCLCLCFQLCEKKHNKIIK